MVFHNEKKFYKDTFNKFNTVNKSMKKEPLISLEIQIRNKKDIIIKMKMLIKLFKNLLKNII